MTAIDDGAALDAYSRTVSGVAEALAPSVANLGSSGAGATASGSRSGPGARSC